MPRETKTVRVAPIPNEALRYYCESWTSPQRPHLVDLSDHFGNGSCSCKDFITRRQPAIRDGKPLFTQATTCRHIQAAHRYWLKHSLEHAAETINAQKTSTRA